MLGLIDFIFDHIGRDAFLRVIKKIFSIENPIWPWPNPFPEPVPLPTPLPTHRVLEHVLIWGLSGTNMSTLADKVVKQLIITYGHDVGYKKLTPRELPGLNMYPHELKYIPYGAVILVDEIQDLSRKKQDSLYSMMNLFALAGHEGHKVNPFTIIGSTRQLNGLYKPLIDRFSLLIEWDTATCEDSIQVLKDYEQRILSKEPFSEYIGLNKAEVILRAHVLALNKPYINTRYEENLSEKAKELVAKRLLGDSRTRELVSKHFRAFASVLNGFSLELALGVLELLGIDENGLHPCDRKIVKPLIDVDNKPMDINALALAASVSLPDLEQMIVPRMVKAKILETTPEGVALTEHGLSLYGVRKKI